jgi:hypothetical protein
MDTTLPYILSVLMMPADLSQDQAILGRGTYNSRLSIAGFKNVWR